MPQNGTTVGAEVESESADYDLYTGAASLRAHDVPVSVLIDDVFDGRVYCGVHHDGDAGDLQVGYTLTAEEAREYGKALIQAAEVADD
jgi:hypothetical protein